VVLERLLYARLYNAGELAQVLFTIGLIFMSVAVARGIYGTLAPPIFLPDYLRGQVHILGRDFPAYRVFLIVFSAAIIFSLWFGVERTRWGAMVRAAVDHRPMAQSVGINTRRLFTLTFALGGGLGSLRGPFIAALLLGIADTACKYWVPQFGAFLIYAATILVLLWRPMGLFGTRV
jgi:branched-chain amino acid transport system permease protein